MKRIIAITIGLFLLTAGASQAAANRMFWATCMTGGGSCLDGITVSTSTHPPTGTAQPGDAAWVVYDSGSVPLQVGYRLYNYTSSPPAASSPDVIIPAATPGNLRWIMAANQRRDIRLYGAKGDGKVYETGSISASSKALTVTSGAFTSADAGKVISVAGAGAVLAVPSAPTVEAKAFTGATTYVYTITWITKYGETTASTSTTITDGYVALGQYAYNAVTRPTPPAGAIGWNVYGRAAGSQKKINPYPLPLTITQWNDTSAYSPSTTDAPSTNTAATQLQTTIAAYVSPTEVTLTAAASTAVSNARVVYGTDNTTPWSNAIAAVYNGGGGTLYIPQGHFILPSSTSYSFPHDNGAANVYWGITPSIMITGEGHSASGQWNHGFNTGSTIDVWATSAEAKLNLNGTGYVEISGLNIIDTQADVTAFLKVTGTTLNFHDNSMRGISKAYIPTGPAITITNPALILGGRTPPPGGCVAYAACSTLDANGLYLGLDPDAPFQGYGTVIERNFFDQVGTITTMNFWADGIQVRDNTVAFGSGNPWGAVFDLAGYSDLVYGNVFTGNYIEIPGYRSFLRMDNASGNVFKDNGLYDGAGVMTAIMNCSVVCYSNTISFPVVGFSIADYLAFDPIGLHYPNYNSVPTPTFGILTWPPDFRYVSSVTSATSIDTGNNTIVHITGTAQINTIAIPKSWTMTDRTHPWQVTLIPDDAFTTGTSGNIAISSTAVAGRALVMTYDGAKWYPSY